MSRTAEHTIQGFLYQFNVTLNKILESSAESIVTVEGIIEDIDIESADSTTAIQCKYHECSEKFLLSAVYKPILQMLAHFLRNKSANVNYVLFAHFPDKSGEASLSQSQLDEILKSKNKELQALLKEISEVEDASAFLEKFSFKFGSTYEKTLEDVRQSLVSNGIPAEDIEIMSYPNALNHIANLSIQRDIEKRKITKKFLLDFLKSVKSTAISRWTLSLKTRKQLLESKKKELKTNLDKNSRLRYLIVFSNSFVDFEQQVVNFIAEYRDKYHSKEAHIYTPLIALSTTEELFSKIQVRLYRLGIGTTDGLVGMGNFFEEERFFREAMRSNGPAGLKREFDFRILRWEDRKTLVNQKKAHDIFVLGEGDVSMLHSEDINIITVASESFTEIKYVMGMSNVSE